jgi:hypothetical protein
VAIEVVIRFCEPQRNQLAVVALRGARQRVERRARLRPASCGKQLLRPRELALVPIRGNQVGGLEPFNCRLRVDRLAAHRIVVVDPPIGLERMIAMRDRLLGTCEGEEDCLRREDFLFAEILEKILGACRGAVPDQDLCEPQRASFPEIALRLADGELRQDGVGFREARQAGQRHAHVVVGVGGKRRRRELLRAHERQSRGELTGRDQLRSAREPHECGVFATARACGRRWRVRDEPVLRRISGQRRMRRRRQAITRR